MRYKVEHEKTYLQAITYYFVYYIDILIATFQMIFQRFLKILQKMSKNHTHSRWEPKIAEDFEEDLKMFRSYTNKFKYSIMVKHNISEVIDVFTSEDMENTPHESLMWLRMNFTSGPVKHACLYNKCCYSLKLSRLTLDIIPDNAGMQ